MDSNVYLALVTVVSTVLLFVYIRLLHLRRLRRPPGPQPWPIVGNIPQLGPHLGKRPHLFLQELSKKYGPVMFLKLGSIPTVVISSADMAREFLVTQGELFNSRPVTLSGSILSYKCQGLAQCRNLPMVTLQRRICAIELLSAKRFQQFQDVRTEELMSAVQNIMEEGKDGQPVNDIVRKLSTVNNNNITRMLFKKTYCDFQDTNTVTGDAREFLDLMTNTVDAATAFFPGDYFPYLIGLDFDGLKSKMWKLRKRWDGFLGSIIKQHQSHRNGGESKDSQQDFVDVILSIREQEKLDDDNVKGLLKDLVMGGTETSANQSAWGIAELVRNPDVQKKLQGELDTVVGRDRLVSESDIPNLPYLRAFVNEIFRRRTVIPILIPHESINLETVRVAGYEIPPKSRLFVNVYAIHMDPSIWTDPFKFDPERFLNTPIQVNGQDEILPFGSGRRACPGMMMGIVMVQLAIAHMAQSFEWSLPEGTDPSVLEDFGTSKVVMGPNLNALKISPRLPLALYTTHAKKV